MYCLKTADIDELTFWSLSDDVANQQLNVAALFSHHLHSRLYFM